MKNTMFQEQANLIRQDILQEMKSERLAMVQEVKIANSNILYTLLVVLTILLILKQHQQIHQINQNMQIMLVQIMFN